MLNKTLGKVNNVNGTGKSRDIRVSRRYGEIQRGVR